MKQVDDRLLCYSEIYHQTNKPGENLKMNEYLIYK